MSSFTISQFHIAMCPKWFFWNCCWHLQIYYCNALSLLSTIILSHCIALYRSTVLRYLHKSKYCTTSPVFRQAQSSESSSNTVFESKVAGIFRNFLITFLTYCTSHNILVYHDTRRQGSEQTVGAAVKSFRATAAPPSNLKMRAVSKERNGLEL